MQFLLISEAQSVSVDQQSSNFQAQEMDRISACETQLLGIEIRKKGGDLDQKPLSGEGISLGNGEHAEAFLFYKSDGTPIVIKKYFKDALGQVRSDFIAFKYLENERENFPFKIALAYSMANYELAMEFASGINLEKLMSSPLYSNELKEELRNIYNKKLGQAIRFFEERCFDYQFRSQESGFGKAQLQIPQALRASCDYGDEFIEFIIKSDNIIVDLKTNEMTLIDPY